MFPKIAYPTYGTVSPMTREQLARASRPAMVRQVLGLQSELSQRPQAICIEMTGAADALTNLLGAYGPLVGGKPTKARISIRVTMPNDDRVFELECKSCMLLA